MSSEMHAALWIQECPTALEDDRWRNHAAGLTGDCKVVKSPRTGSKEARQTARFEGQGCTPGVHTCLVTVTWPIRGESAASLSPAVQVKNFHWGGFALVRAHPRFCLTKGFFAQATGASGRALSLGSITNRQNSSYSTLHGFFARLVPHKRFSAITTATLASGKWTFFRRPNTAGGTLTASVGAPVPFQWLRSFSGKAPPKTPGDFECFFFVELLLISGRWASGERDNIHKKTHVWLI